VISNSFKFRFTVKSVGLFIAALIVSSLSLAQQTPSISKLYGEVSLMSNYVDKGLTQSDAGISVGAGAGYAFGTQGRIGLHAASVNYPGEDANVEVAGFGEFKFVFTPNSDLRLRNDWIRFTPENQRDRVAVLLDQNIFTYHVLLFREDNFEGTKKPRNWFAFNKDWNYSTSIQLNATVGYSMVDGYDNYFDTRVGASYLTGPVTISLVNTYVSEPDQFGNRADMAFFLVVAAKF
jgi:uncharacterized protein (TIGR02001 family)